MDQGVWRTETGRPLSVELRAAEFTKIFQPLVYKPKPFELCETFEARKGAFAALGRCAKCNFREEEHGHKSTAPKWNKRTHKADITTWVKIPLPDVVVATTDMGTVSEPAKVETPINDAEAREPAKTDMTIGLQQETQVILTEISPSEPKTESPKVALDEILDDDEEIVHSDSHNVDHVAQDDEEEEEDVRRPSWAPPPLIDLESDQGSAASVSPGNPDQPKRRMSRSFSWLARNRSSNSDSSNSPNEDSPKRASLRLLASTIRAKMSSAKDTWESKIGDSMPTCNRCGRLIEPSHRIVYAGVSRAHEVCPSKEESEKGPRNPRYMVQKAQDRIVVTFRCDKDTKQPYTFIYDLDLKSRQSCLRLRNFETMTLVYIADQQSHASLERKFKVPKSREFDISVRYTHKFSFQNPATEEVVTPEFDLLNKRVVVTKYCTSNQVLHKVVAGFSYDEEERILSPTHLTFSYSLMPGVQARLPTFVIQGQHNTSVGMAKRLEDRIKAKVANKTMETEDRIEEEPAAT